MLSFFLTFFRTLIIILAEVLKDGPNLVFVLSNLSNGWEVLYLKMYTHIKISPWHSTSGIQIAANDIDFFFSNFLEYVGNKEWRRMWWASDWQSWQRTCQQAGLPVVSTDTEKLLIYFFDFPSLDKELRSLYLGGQDGFQSCQHFISPAWMKTDLQVLSFTCAWSSTGSVVAGFVQWTKGVNILTHTIVMHQSLLP